MPADTTNVSDKKVTSAGYFRLLDHSLVKIKYRVPYSIHREIQLFSSPDGAPWMNAMNFLKRHGGTTKDMPTINFSAERWMLYLREDPDYVIADENETQVTCKGCFAQRRTRVSNGQVAISFLLDHKIACSSLQALYKLEIDTQADQPSTVGIRGNRQALATGGNGAQTESSMGGAHPPTQDPDAQSDEVPIPELQASRSSQRIRDHIASALVNEAGSLSTLAPTPSSRNTSPAKQSTATQSKSGRRPGRPRKNAKIPSISEEARQSALAAIARNSVDAEVNDDPDPEDESHRGSSRKIFNFYNCEIHFH